MLKPRLRRHTPAPGAREKHLAILTSIKGGEVSLPPRFAFWRISNKDKGVWMLGSQAIPDVQHSPVLFLPDFYI